MICYLVRHGESAFNAEKRIQGQMDVPLSALGLRQADALANALADHTIVAVYSSPLARAVQTAKPLAARHGLQVERDPRLMEIHAGILQGLCYEEMAERHPECAAKWADGDPDYIIPEGESRRALMARGLEVFEEIFAAGKSPAVVVAHGGLLAAALKALLGIAPERNPFRFYNASISKLVVESQIKLLVLNRVDHLRAIDDAPEQRVAEL